MLNVCQSAFNLQHSAFSAFTLHPRRLAVLDWLEEWHQFTQLGADLFEPLILFLFTLRVEPGAALAILLNPVFRVGAVLDFGEHLTHLIAGFFRDDARTTGV